MTKCKCRRLCIHEKQAVLFFVVVFYDSIVSEHGKSKQEQHPDIVQSICEKAVFFYLKAQAVFEIKPKINSSIVKEFNYIHIRFAETISK